MDRGVPAAQTIVDAFKPPSSAICLNAWCFSALVFSLFAALVGLLSKQWLREYLRQGSASPRSAARLRQYRFEGLTRWRVAYIIGSMPMMLEIALMLFLVGLVEFLWTLDDMVAGINTFIVVMTLSFYLGTMVIPSFAPGSPFRSPQAWAFVCFLWGMIPPGLFSGRTPRSATAEHTRMLLGRTRIFACLVVGKSETTDSLATTESNSTTALLFGPAHRRATATSSIT